MKTKGMSNEFVGMLMLLLFIGIATIIVLWSYQATVSVEDLVESDELSVNKKVIYARVISSSSTLAYEDGNGINKGVFDIDKIKSLDSNQLFQLFGYQPDHISTNGFLHYVKIELLDESDKVEFSQSSSLPSRDILEFPVNVRYSDDNIKLAKLYVDIIPK